jgi:hypothetical protein
VLNKKLRHPAVQQSNKRNPAVQQSNSRQSPGQQRSKKQHTPGLGALKKAEGI